MNNVDCSSIPGHWTQLSLISSLSSPLSCSTHLSSIPPFYSDFMYHHAPLPLLFLSVCSFYLFSVSLSSIETFHYISVLFFELFLSLPLSLTLFFLPPSLFLCESIKKLFTVIFFFPAWAWAECLADLWGAPMLATVAAAVSIFPHYLPYTSM